MTTPLVTVYLLGSIFIGKYLNIDSAKSDIKKDMKQRALAGYYIEESDYSIA